MRSYGLLCGVVSVDADPYALDCATNQRQTNNERKMFAQCPSNQQRQQWRQQHRPKAELAKYEQHLWYAGLCLLCTLNSLYLFPKKLPLILIHNTILDTVEMLATNDVFVTLLRFVFVFRFFSCFLSLALSTGASLHLDVFVASISSYRNYIGHNDSALHQYWFYCFIVLFP